MMPMLDWNYCYQYTQMPPQTYPTMVVVPGEYPPAPVCHYVEPLPPPTIMHTKDIPLKPMMSTNPASDKKIGKSLSCYTKNMEVVWHGEFNRLCQHFLPHHWYLSPSLDMPLDQQWFTFTDCAKVRFLCKFCAHGWTSMKGRVVFTFYLNCDTSTGIVFFRLFGQKCQSCSPETFEHAMWYPEEVIKVIGNLFNRIGQEYYGFYSPPVRVDRRAGKPQAKHNKEFCQACNEGICPNFELLRLDGYDEEESLVDMQATSLSAQVVLAPAKSVCNNKCRT